MANQYTNPWTPEMDDFLYEHANSKKYSWIAKQLGKTITAVDKRIQSLGIEDKHGMSGTFTANQVAQVLGKDSKVVLTWIRERGLKAERRSHLTSKIQDQESRKYQRYFIEPEAVWKWVSKNRQAIDFTKVQRGVLLPEPDWLRAEILSAMDSGRKAPRTAWTEDEEKMVWDLYYSGMMQKDIAAKIGRTVNSVEKRIKKMRERKLQKI